MNLSLTFNDDNHDSLLSLRTIFFILQGTALAWIVLVDLEAIIAIQMLFVVATSAVPEPLYELYVTLLEILNEAVSFVCVPYILFLCKFVCIHKIMFFVKQIIFHKNQTNHNVSSSLYRK